MYHQRYKITRGKPSFLHTRTSSTYMVLLTLCALTLLLLGCFVIGRPIVLNLMNSRKSVEIVREYEKQLETLENQEELFIRTSIQSYNNYLSSLSFHIPWSKAEPNYATLPLVRDSEVLGSLTIPTLGIKDLVIYRDDTETQLKTGVGHVPNTSIPLGENHEHAVFAAHSGRENMLLFSKLDQLKRGDVFEVKILGDTHQYEVIEKNIVTPEDINLLFVQKDKSLVTLLTCYPTGINTHRLLVTGQVLPEMIVVPEDTLTNVMYDTVHPLVYVGIAVLFLTLLVVILTRKKRYYAVRNEEKLYLSGHKIESSSKVRYIDVGFYALKPSQALLFREKERMVEFVKYYVDLETTSATLTYVRT